MKNGHYTDKMWHYTKKNDINYGFGAGFRWLDLDGYMDQDKTKCCLFL
jgi:hypothetical protein